MFRLEIHEAIKASLFYSAHNNLLNMENKIDSVSSLLKSGFNLVGNGPTWLQFTWTVGNRRAHVHEAQSTAGQRFPAAGAAGDFRFGGRAPDAVLAEASALVRYGRAAVGDGLPTEVAAHKHLKDRKPQQEVILSERLDFLWIKDSSCAR